MVKKLFSLLIVMVSGPTAVASAQGGAVELGWGLGGLLLGVAALLIAVGALFVFIRLAQLLEGLEEYFKRK